MTRPEIPTIKLRQFMRSGSVTVDPDETVQHASTRMAVAAIPAALVIENGRLVGILTDRDISKKVVAKRLDPALTLVSDIMTRDPVRVSDDRDVQSAILVMRARGVQELAVQDLAGKFVGVVCGCDLCNSQWEDM